MKPYDRIAIRALVAGFVLNVTLVIVIALLSEQPIHSVTLHDSIILVLLLYPPYVLLAFRSRHLARADPECGEGRAAGALTAVFASSLTHLILPWVGHSVGEGLALGAMWLVYLLGSPLVILLGSKTAPAATAVSLRLFSRSDDHGTTTVPVVVMMFLINFFVYYGCVFAILGLIIMLGEHAPRTPSTLGLL